MGTVQRILSIIFSWIFALHYISIEAKESKLQFEGLWNSDCEPTFEIILEKIIKYFIPYNPTIIEIGIHMEEETLLLAKRFPKGRVIAFEQDPQIFNQLENKATAFTNLFLNNEDILSTPLNLNHWCALNEIHQIDLIRIDANELSQRLLKSSSNLLKTTSVIFIKTSNSSKRKSGEFSVLKSRLTALGFKLLSYWYSENFSGNSVFIRKEIYDSLFT